MAQPSQGTFPGKSLSPAPFLHATPAFVFPYGTTLVFVAFGLGFPFLLHDPQKFQKNVAFL